MRRLALALLLSLTLLSTQNALADVPTSPAGIADERPSTMPMKVLVWARSFRGNPLPLGILTGGILVVAAVFGAYTLVLAYRRPGPAD
jgi:hypothetical protein